MSLLHLHTQLLESLDWDDEAVDSATRRATEIYAELIASDVQPTAYNMKKKLNDEYSETVTENLILFFDACSKFKEELSEDDGETND